MTRQQDGQLFSSVPWLFQKIGVRPSVFRIETS